MEFLIKDFIFTIKILKRKLLYTMKLPKFLMKELFFTIKILKRKLLFTIQFLKRNYFPAMEFFSRNNSKILGDSMLLAVATCHGHNLVHGVKYTVEAYFFPNFGYKL